MTEAKFIVNEKNFVPAFGMKFFRLLAERWQLDSINRVMERLSCLQSISDDITFEQIDTITDMICASVYANPENTEPLTYDEVSDMFLKDVAEITSIAEQVVKGFMASLPQMKNVGKPKAAKK
jgi:hypothetical protein